MRKSGKLASPETIHKKCSGRNPSFAEHCYRAGDQLAKDFRAAYRIAPTAVCSDGSVGRLAGFYPAVAKPQPEEVCSTLRIDFAFCAMFKRRNFLPRKDNPQC
jgi:hypothetical protein